MSGLFIFLKCIAVGVAVAAPLGPVGTLCINRTLHRGFRAGIAAGIGSGMADTVFALCAAIGLGAITSLLAEVDVLLRVGGGAFLVFLGWRSMHPRPTHPPVKTIGKRSLAATMGGAFLLTIANPITLLSFAAIFAGLGLADLPGGADALIVCAGVFSGAMGWWLALCSGVSLARRRLDGSISRWASRISGGLILAFGIATLGSYLLARLGAIPY